MFLYPISRSVLRLASLSETQSRTGPPRRSEAVVVNNAKHTYAKQSVHAKRGWPRKDAAAPAAATRKSSSLAVEDIVAVKELVDRFGKESLTRLVEVL